MAEYVADEVVVPAVGAIDFAAQVFGAGIQWGEAAGTEGVLMALPSWASLYMAMMEMP